MPVNIEMERLNSDPNNESTNEDYNQLSTSEKIRRFLESAKKTKLDYKKDVVENSKILLEVSIDDIKNYLNNANFTISSLYLCYFLHAICQGGIDDDNLKQRLDLIFEAIDNNIFEIEGINREDRLHLTPLHYTVYLKDTHKTKTLLKRRATLAVKDDLKFMPVHNFSTKEEFEEILDFVMPQKEDRGVIETTVCFKINMANLLPEKNTQLQSELLFVIAQKFPLLLKHPLVLCLIAAFWVKAGRIFFAQLFFNALFTLCFLISSFYFGDSNVLIPIFVLVFIVKALLQITFIRNRNFRNLENSFSLLINVLAISLGLLAMIVRDVGVIKCYYAATNLIIMIQFLFIFSIFSKKVEMLKIVFITFVKCLIILVFLLLVFALSLYLLSNQTDNFIIACYNMGLSILTAELKDDFSDNIWINTSSKVIFVIFVLFICIMLTNFLNSLAVSDVQELKRDADLNSSIQLVKYIFALDYLFRKITYFRIKSTVELEGDRTKSLSVFDIFRTGCLDERWVRILNEKLIEMGKINLTYTKYNIKITDTNTDTQG